MSELTQTLKIYVTRYPGTMAELARKASIDRSTLYKIVSGQRTPREFQLEHLADALELSEEQKSALLLQYKQRGRGPDPKLRAELHHLLEVSFRVEDFTHREGLISNEAASQLRCSEQYIEGSRAVAAAVASLVANHILSGDTRPLLLSPFTNPTLDHVLVERFSAADGAPVALSQLLVYAENRDIPREWVSGVSVLTRTLRIVDSAQLAPTPSMSVNVFQGRGVVFCQAIREPDGQYCREYLMQDPILTESLLAYLDDGHASDWLRSQKYTLDFIDYCLRLL